MRRVMILAAPFLFLALPLWAEENQDSNQPPENNVGIEANQPLTAPNAEPSNANSDGAPAPCLYSSRRLDQFDLRGARR